MQGCPWYAYVIMEATLVVTVATLSYVSGFLVGKYRKKSDHRDRKEARRTRDTSFQDGEEMKDLHGYTRAHLEAPGFEHVYDMVDLQLPPPPQPAPAPERTSRL